MTDSFSSRKIYVTAINEVYEQPLFNNKKNVFYYIIKIVLDCYWPSELLFFSGSGKLDWLWGPDMILIALPFQRQVKSFQNTLTSTAMSRIRSSLELSAAAWSRFWAMFLVFVQSNVPYRLLHQKVNTRLQMSIYNSELYQASCLFCFQDTETIP